MSNPFAPVLDAVYAVKRKSAYSEVTSGFYQRYMRLRREMPVETPHASLVRQSLDRGLWELIWDEDE